MKNIIKKITGISKIIIKKIIRNQLVNINYNR
jgi:hypothetical protein